jgi:hypothetical protein
VGADLIEIVREPVEVEILLPRSRPAAARFDQRPAVDERHEALNECRRLSKVMKRIEERDEIYSIRWAVFFDIASLEANIRRPTSRAVGLRLRNGCRTVIDTEEREVRPACGELAGNFTRAAAEIDDSPRPRKRGLNQIRKPTDGRVTRVCERKRFVVVALVERLMELAVGSCRPSSPRPVEFADKPGEEAEHQRF